MNGKKRISCSMPRCKIIILGISLIVFFGCVSTKNLPLPENTISRETIQSFIVTKRDKPHFIAQTTGKALIGGLVGALAATSAGDELVRENGIEDPAHYIGAEIYETMATRYRTERITDDIALLEDGDLDEIGRLYGAAAYVIDVETTNWGLTYFPTDWNNYRVVYHAKLRIIDPSDKQVLAEGFCSRVPEQDKNSPSYKEMIANNAERLKTELKIAADYCKDQFLRETLNLEGQ